jgi:hypothetical protein
VSESRETLIVIDLLDDETLEEWFERAAPVIEAAPVEATLVLPRQIFASMLTGGDA